MSAGKVEVVVKHAAQTVGEGPHWVDKTQSLLYVDIYANDLFRWNPTTNVTETHHFDDFVSLVVPTEKDDYIISLGNKLARLEWNSKKIDILHTAIDRVRYNDGKCDPSGRLLAGTMGLETAPAVLPPEMGSLYSLGIDGNTTVVDDKITLSNGLAWTQDTKNFYFVDSIPRQVYMYDYDVNSGQASNKRTLLNFPDFEPNEMMGLPDGMAIDTQDKIWIACFSVGKVIRFDPPTGKILQVVNIDAKRTTSCCFGGPNLDELYVTSSKMGVSEEEFKTDPLAGSIFKVTGLGVKGYPAFNYKG